MFIFPYNPRYRTFQICKGLEGTGATCLVVQQQQFRTIWWHE